MSASLSSSPAADALATLLQDAPLRPWRHAPMVAAVLAAHIGAGWALMQVDSVREAVREAAPLMVDLIAAEPPKPKPLPPPPPPPAPPKRVLPPPRPAPIVAAPPAPSPAPAAFTAPPPTIEPPPAAVAINPPAEPAPPAPPAPPAQPRTVPASAVQYLVPPAPVYPSVSQRRGESGRVLLRVLIDEGGVPRQVALQQSSDHPRLDDSAFAAVKAARFRPYIDNGIAQPVWVLIPIVFDLEK